MKLNGKKLLAILISASLMMSGNLTVSAQAQEVISDATMAPELVSDVEIVQPNTTSVIEISTEEDLKNIANDLTGNYVLKNDIVLSGKEWTSIAPGIDIWETSDYFTGTFDGAGHTISNLYSTKGESLFGALGESAIVKNLTVSGSVDTKTKVAALLAVFSEGTISNCVSSGSVKQTYYEDCAYSLAGMVVSNYGHMEKCVNKAIVEHSYQKIYEGYDMAKVGGITAVQAGTLLACSNEGKIISDCMVSGGITGGNYNFIKDCVNKGNVTAKHNASGASLVVGGITGANVGVIYNCFNQGKVCSIVNNQSYAIGGICGESSSVSQIIGCENTGIISGFIGEFGGICGEANITSGFFDENDEFQAMPGEMLISDCINKGKIEGTSVSGYTTSGAGCIGRVGTAAGKIKILNCTNEGAVSGKGDADSSGVIGVIHTYKKGSVMCHNLINTGMIYSEKGTAYGVSGLAQANVEGSPIIINNCINKGNVSGECAYGIGSMSNVHLSCSYNEGNIYAGDFASGITVNIYGRLENCYNLGNITGGQAVGFGWSIGDGSVLVDVYNVGTVKGERIEYGMISDFGDINYANIKNCYYLEQDFLSKNQIGTAVDAMALQNQSTYVGFDFDNIWIMKNQNGMNLPGFRSTNNKSLATLTKTDENLSIGESITLKAITGTVIKYFSGNSVIIDVSSEGKVTAKCAGNACVYAIFDDGQVLSCKVSVEGDISKAKVSISQSTYYYDGKTKTPSVTVKLGSAILKKNTDYTVAFSKNKNIGTATVTIKGKGNYAGTVKKTFKITVKKGASYTVDAYKYKISSSSAVAFTGIKSTSTKKVTIPKTVKIGGKSFKVTSIASKALYKKTKVTTVSIGSNVKTIGTSAFEGCTKLSKVTIGSNVTKIGDKAFKGCKVLKSVTVPSKVTTIGKEAFRNCSKLSTITIKSTKLKSVGKNAFKGIKSTAKIKVPSKKLSAYKKLLKGKGQSSKVKITK